jgi:hypothetical protein
LGHTHESDVPSFEEFGDPNEVQQAATESVDLVDDHAIDVTGVDFGKETLERRTLHISTAETTIIVPLGEGQPSLTGDVRLSCLALDIERREIPVEPFVRTLPRVNRAPGRLRRGRE